MVIIAVMTVTTDNKEKNVKSFKKLLILTK